MKTAEETKRLNEVCNAIRERNKRSENQQSFAEMACAAGMMRALEPTEKGTSKI